MHMRRSLILIVVPALLVTTSSISAIAHRTRDFDACVTYGRQVTGERCYGNLDFSAGETVFLRGRVRPPHAHRTARLLRKDPGTAGWTEIAVLDISDRGRMHFEWHTDADDVSPEPGPYGFKFRIAHHGVSDRVYVFVLA